MFYFKGISHNAWCLFLALDYAEGLYLVPGIEPGLIVTHYTI